MNQEEMHNAIIQLRCQLSDAGIDTFQWGIGGTKTLEHLQKEIESGETALNIGDNNELYRIVSVCGADVYYSESDGTEYRLKEDRQVFSDGSERQRNLVTSVGEKMKQGEDPKGAMTRGVYEELGIEGDISVEETGKSDEVRESPSYPGLKSHYFHHRFKVVLSKEQFNPNGYVEEQDGLTTYFVWVTE